VTVSRHCPVAPAPGDINEICSYAIDAWFDEIAVLTDEHALLAVMNEAASAGHAHVLDHATATFPNGAISAVLLLAESHLSVHTWPEHGLARFDLLTCGALNAESIIAYLQSSLKPRRSTVTRTIRDLRQPLRSDVGSLSTDRS
jgi:S-adenosylmethionine decarboxylase